MLGSFFKLGSILSPGTKSNTMDTFKTHSVLNGFGYNTQSPNGLLGKPNEGLFSGIKAFQQGHDLKVDGIMKPGGETEAAINAKLSETRRGFGNTPSASGTASGLDKPDSPSTAASPSPTKSLFGPDVGRTPEQPTATEQATRKPTFKERKPWWQSTTVPAASDDDIADNARATKVLLGYSNNKEHPRWISEDIANGYPGARRKLVDLANQLEASQKGRGHLYVNDVEDRLDELGRRRLRAIAAAQPVQQAQVHGRQSRAGTPAQAAQPSPAQAKPSGHHEPREAPGPNPFDKANKTPDGEAYRYKIADGIEGQKVPPPLVSPTTSGKIRKPDNWGEGRYGAKRGGRHHKGTDYVAKPGERIVSTVSGKVVNVQGVSYGKPRDPRIKEPTYRIVDIETEDDYIIRHHYVSPGVKQGDVVKAGKSVLGTAQDLTRRYNGITNHVHIEMRDSRMPVPKYSKGSRLTRTKDIKP